MQLLIKNIGILKEADIKLSGLTVIAGENDSGKSTVGKLMFSIVKAIGKYKDELEENKENNIKHAVDNIYFAIRRALFRENNHHKALFRAHSFINEINAIGIEALTDKINYLKEIDAYNTQIEALFTNLKKIIGQDYDKKSAIKRAFKKVVYSEFNGEISLKKTEQSSIKISEDGYDILKIDLSKNQLSKFDLKDDLYFNDSLIVETPMILNFSESIRNSKSIFEATNKQSRLRSLGRANISFHTKDLEVKLRDSFYGENLFINQGHNDLYNKITKIINGKIKFVEERNEFVYFRGKEEHNIINVASGIKSFGILQILLSSSLLDTRSLIVLDEPEVHLHPNWQLKYAEIITLLVKNGFNILVTTHSPYMLEALERYAHKYEIEEKTNFYLAKDGVIKSENNNKTLSETFSKLSQPFDIFNQMDADKL